jgi:hypothetical protein
VEQFVDALRAGCGFEMTDAEGDILLRGEVGKEGGLLGDVAD